MAGVGSCSTNPARNRRRQERRSYDFEGSGRIAHDKPDICAPGSFHEDHDAASGNGGTSAACAIVAGLIAAFRSRMQAAGPSADVLKAALAQTARHLPGQSGFSNRYGHGVIDAERLRAQFPSASLHGLALLKAMRATVRAGLLRSGGIRLWQKGEQQRVPEHLPPRPS